jgi:hypothetical protein
MKILAIVIVAFAFAFAACSSAQKASTTPPQMAPPAPVAQNTPPATPKVTAAVVKKEICESGSDSRFLEVHKKPTGCDLTYKKFGIEKIVASGKYGLKHCESSLNKITKKLEGDKFTCRQN